MGSTVSVLVSAAVVFIMAVVGLELTRQDFRRVSDRVPLIFAALLAQWVALPVVTVGIVLLLSPPPIVVGGMALVAATPIAAMSNFYVLLARGNLGLAVSLTAVSSALAVVAAPIVATLVLRVLPEQAAGFSFPVREVLWQAALTLVLPIVAGMTVRALAGTAIEKWRSLAQRLSLFAALGIVAVVLLTQLVAMPSSTIHVLMTSALLFTVFLSIIGALVGRAFTRKTTDVVALAYGFPARNLGFATILALHVAGRADFAAFAAVFFVTQLVILAPLAMYLSRLTPAAA